jgi:2-amino-4-hydroxy-6-hydroxymethyldihydropteridine diphosphokinase
MRELYVGLGANIGDPAAQLKEAVTRVAAVMSIEDISSVYWTEPVGMRDQPYFLNAVIRARTALTPDEALAALSRIEEEMGRRREMPLGPRTIDLDLLLYEDLMSDEPLLSLPHPRMAMRRFVLAPLAEIAPGLSLEKGGPRVVEILAALPAGESVERIVLPGWPPPV